MPGSYAPTGKSFSQRAAGMAAARGRQLRSGALTEKPPSRRQLLRSRRRPAAEKSRADRSASLQQSATMVAPCGLQPRRYALDREVVHAPARQDGRARRPAAEESRAARGVTLAAVSQKSRPVARSRGRRMDLMPSSRRSAGMVALCCLQPGRCALTGTSSTQRSAQMVAPRGRQPRSCALTGKPSTPDERPARRQLQEAPRGRRAQAVGWHRERSAGDPTGVTAPNPARSRRLYAT